MNYTDTTKYPTWKRLGERTLYKGRVHIVEHDVRLPDGSRSKYEVDHSAMQAVAVLVRTSQDEVILSYQYRFPIDSWIYDLPGGATRAGEGLEAAARRECREEVGIDPNHLVKLAKFYPNPGRSDWAATVFFCDSYEEAASVDDDASETVERVTMSIATLEKLVQSGDIIDPSLPIAWHTARAHGLL